MKALGKFNDILRVTGFQLTHLPVQSKNNEPVFVLTDQYITRQKIINHYRVNKILDIGANTGQFATVMRNIGFKGDIVSFEPLSSAFAVLKLKTEDDPNWHSINTAIGDKEGISVIHVAGNSYSGSMLNMLSTHEAYDPDSKYVGSETITIKTLDSLFPDICSPDDIIYIKIDTQGFEKQVIYGAEKSLQSVSILQVELSLEQLYENEPLFDEMYNMITDRGFKVLTFENGITDADSGGLLQVDVIFRKVNQ